MAKVSEVMDYLKTLKADDEVIWQVVSKSDLEENIGRKVSVESFAELADMDSRYAIVADQVSNIVSEVYSGINEL